MKVFCLWCVRAGGRGAKNTYWCCLSTDPWQKGSYILFLPARPHDTYFTCSKRELPVEYSRRICFGNNIAKSKNRRPLLTLSVIFTCVSFHPQKGLKAHYEPREGAGLVYTHLVSRGAGRSPANLLTPNSSLTAGLPGTLDRSQREMGRGRKNSGV